MTIPEHLKFSICGFSGKRVGYVLAFVSIALVPAHFYISCEASGEVAAIGVILFLLTSILSFIPRGKPKRFRAVAFAFVALIGHMLCAH